MTFSISNNCCIDEDKKEYCYPYFVSVVRLSHFTYSPGSPSDDLAEVITGLIRLLS